MKTFKRYVSEEQNIHSTKDMIFSDTDPHALILSPTSLKRSFGGKLARITAWHITNIEGLAGIKKIQGRKSAISVMTEIEPTDPQPFEGLETSGGIVIELEGTELMSEDRDAWTDRLEYGRRGVWIKEKTFPILFREIGNMIEKMYKKYAKSAIMETVPYSKGAWNTLGDDVSQKLKGRLVGEYIDNCESIIKNSKNGKEELRRYGRAMGDLQSGERAQHFYNESVINRITIKQVYVVLEGSRGREPIDLDDAKAIWPKAQLKPQNEIKLIINKKS
jgi:hypothetical protein